MKQAVLFLSFLCMSCNCAKNQVNNSIVKKTSSSSCPNDGKCTTNLIENKSLNIKTDATGAIYYELTDNSKTSIIKFEYNKTVDTTFQDNSYREEVLFEIPNQFDEINLKDDKLELVKMIFGKHCFCKGQAGIFTIIKGKLNLKKKEKTTSFNLEFEILNIDHKIKKISGTIK
ncbi:hypothetical protein [Flavobacterium sp. LMO9]|nr:hypothetical protein [Flavobacterium sp. LMO9]MQP53308.1 hypothetical protein [Flavobacterium sp. LMO9]MQP63319.1 hypothetical protein [Flavobacterium sp. LMO6]